MSDNDLDLPFEEVPGGPITGPIDPAAILCGGIVVRSAAIESPAGRLPALILDLYRVDGHRLPPVLLVTEDPEQLRKVVPLIEASVACAIKAAGA